jgi:hypothetical protein
VLFLYNGSEDFCCLSIPLGLYLQNSKSIGENMKFTVYQFSLSDDQYENRDLREMFLDTFMNPTPEAIQKAFSLYKKVAEIETKDFEGVFEVGNLGPKTKLGESITRFLPMHSVSVGDVVVREDGVTKFVANIGFESVTL